MRWRCVRTELEAAHPGGGPGTSAWSPASQLPPAPRKHAELKHLFVNLLLNARDAMPLADRLDEARREDDSPW